MNEGEGPVAKNLLLFEIGAKQRIYQ